MIGNKLHSRYKNISRYLPLPSKDTQICCWVEPFGGSFGLGTYFNNMWQKSIYCEIDTEIFNKYKDLATISYNQDWKKTISDFNTTEHFFFIDPPYYGKEKYYNHVFNEHLELSEMLKNVKFKFILIYNDCSYIRNLYKDFNQIIDYNDREILIINFSI